MGSLSFSKRSQVVKKKSPTLSKAKKKAWDAFSRYIRTRDALRTTGTLTTVKCVTCQKVFALKQTHAGHFIPGRKGYTLFDERGVFAQCGVCNLWLKGNSIEYWLHMEKQYGRELIDELIERNKQIKHYSISECEALEQEYKQKTKELYDRATTVSE